MPLYATSYYDEERQSQRLKLKGDKEVAQEQLDKLVAGQLACVYVRMHVCTRMCAHVCVTAVV